ncbi:hypothetical protein QU38_00405, partial [Staphylococcus aureus]
SPPGSERNLVVHVVTLGWCGAARRTAAALPASAPAFAGIAAVAAAAHAEFAIEAGQHDLGRIPLLAILLPLAGLQLALEVDLGALPQVLLGDPGEVLVPDHDRMPVGALLALAAALVAPLLGRGDAHVAD